MSCPIIWYMFPARILMSTSILGTESTILATALSPVAKVTFSIDSDGANFESPAASARFKGCRSFTVERITSHPTLKGNVCTVRILFFVPWKWFQMFHKMFKLGGIEFSETAKSPKIPKLPHILKPQTQPRHSKIWSYLQVRLRYAAWKSCERCHPCQSVRCIEKHNLSRETQVTGHLKKYKPTWFTKISVLNYNSAIQRFIILWRGHSQRSSADRLCLTLQTVQKLNPPLWTKLCWTFLRDTDTKIHGGV